MTTLLDLILKARASENGTAYHSFDGSGRWLEVDARKSAKTRYTYGSGFVEVDHLTRKAAARLLKETCK